ncbi:MAG TPA: hypothetical protein VNC50_15685 [Planctomycetia bacterium]|nr:hypothetical protein [Planctomycetia bacterium]
MKYAPRRPYFAALYSLVMAGALRADDVTDWHDALVSLTVIASRDAAPV